MQIDKDVLRILNESEEKFDTIEELWDSLYLVLNSDSDLLKARRMYKSKNAISLAIFKAYGKPLLGNINYNLKIELTENAIELKFNGHRNTNYDISSGTCDQCTFTNDKNQIIQIIDWIRELCLDVAKLAQEYYANGNVVEIQSWVENLIGEIDLRRN